MSSMLFLSVCGLIIFCGLIGLIRNQSVYRERGKWLAAVKHPSVDDPMFLATHRINERILRHHNSISYDLMVFHFWKPVRSWRPPIEEWRKIEGWKSEVFGPGPLQ